MRVIREIDTRRGVGGAAAGIDAERTDFPVGGNCADHEEDENQRREEEKEAKPPPLATVRLAIRAGRADGWRWGYKRLRDCGRRKRGGILSRRRNGGGIVSRRRNGCGSLHGRLCLWVGCHWRSRLGRSGSTRELLELCPGGTDWRCRCRRSHHWGGGESILYSRLRQPGKPLLQLGLIGSRILRLYGTPREEAHVRSP